MRRFTNLYTQLDQTTKTKVKVSALSDYFKTAPDPDKVWVIALLSHRRPRRSVNATQMKEWAAVITGLPFWLVDESHHIVGDLAETIALILPESQNSTDENLSYWMEFILKLRSLDEADRKKQMTRAWNELDESQRMIFNKLITGGFRIGVSQKLMVRALAGATDIEESLLAHRLMGNWSPESSTYRELVLTGDSGEKDSRPYPFFLAHPLENEPDSLGVPANWQAEMKWDGIRGQIIRRNGSIHVWSRGEELVTDKYPEFEIIAEQLPDGLVFDGEILPFRNGQPLPFTLLQKRIGRKTVSKALLKKAPVIFMAYDLLEYEGQDIRNKTLRERRTLLEKVIRNAPKVFQLSQTIPFSTWHNLAEERDAARSRMTEGLMLKRLDSPYQVGRKRGDWWKWKVDPLTIDAVMIYAMRGHGRRANLYTDYTFALRDGENLIPFTKAYSGLTDKEIARVDHFVKRNTVERFGPVRSVRPELVFEIAFEGINKSNRHKSGVALRFPRIKRWREDKPPEEINTIDDLHRMLEMFG